MLDLSLRNTESSSSFGLFLQKHLNIDARKIDHLIKSQFSYFGDATLKLSNIGATDKNSNFGITDLGFFKSSSAYNSPVVKEFMTFAKEWRLTSRKEYKIFQNKASEYYAEESDTKKEELSKELIDLAEEILQFWDENDFKGMRQKRHELKKQNK